MSQADSAKPDATDKTRTLACAECGTTFVCDLSGNCWCAAEDVRLPIPDTSLESLSGDCLCRDCLRHAGQERAPD